MNEQMALEVLGYVASVLVAVSLMMSSILRLRLINLVGSAAFATYGFLIGAYPVAAVNSFIVCINLYYLAGMLRQREYFKLLEVRPDSEYLDYFLNFHATEIRDRLGAPASARPGVVLFVLRDLVPAGLLMGDVRGHTLHVALDYVIPRYRDMKVARYLFGEQAAYFRKLGVTEILSPPGPPEHERYLRRMGFAPTDPRSAGAPYRLVLA